MTDIKRLADEHDNRAAWLSNGEGFHSVTAATLRAQKARIEQLEAALATARVGALREALAIDWRNEWIKNHDRMKRAGESKEMAGRWFGAQVKAVILHIINKGPKP